LLTNHFKSACWLPL